MYTIRYRLCPVTIHRKLSQSILQFIKDGFNYKKYTNETRKQYYYDMLLQSEICQ